MVKFTKIWRKFSKATPPEPPEPAVSVSFESKEKRVLQHIQDVGWITSLQAIKLYWATRLSATIFRSKRENGGMMNIGTFSFRVTTVDKKGKKHTTHPACYYDADRFTENEIRARSGLW